MSRRAGCVPSLGVAVFRGLAGTHTAPDPS
jgi:hypothetical protein